MGLRKRPSLAAFALAFVVHVVASLVTRAAHGAEAAAAAPDPAVRVVTSKTVGSDRASDALRPGESAVAWTTTYELSPAEASDLAFGVGPTSRVIRFAVPLPEGSRLEVGAPLAPEVDERGRVVGVWLTREAVVGRSVTVTCVQPGPLDASRPLCAPIAAGTATQIVVGSFGGGARLEVAPKGVLEEHIGYVASPGASRPAREHARRVTGHRDHASGRAIYVRGDDVRAMGGLTGAAAPPRAASRGSFVTIAVVFGMAVAALVVALRRLGRAASLERADAILLAELEREAR